MPAAALRTGWACLLAKVSVGLLLFEAGSGLAITVSPFGAAGQWSVLAHTLAGVALLLPLGWYVAAHWLDYRHYAPSQIMLLGLVGTAGLLVCCLSGVVVTWQGLWALRTSVFWRDLHLVSALVTMGTLLPHVLLAFRRVRRDLAPREASPFLKQTLAFTVMGLLLIAGLTALYSGRRYVNRFPKDYSFLYGKDRPFAPSLARTDTGGAFEADSLAGSRSCGTAGCHQEIYREWEPSAHRYAAMDLVFQKIQAVMARQNGPESTRYCAGCHDPISLFSGTKTLFAKDLTSRQGYQEGVSCLVCHSIRETDLKGNADYTVTQPRAYLWQWTDHGLGRVARDFLIRAYPVEHERLSKRLYKTPQYCAACHKQFIDKEVNHVGWVQLQNQYDNWAVSHWNHPGDPRRTVECRECHMPLIASPDPSGGDPTDYNRRADDGKHRSHRFLASNRLMPALLKLPGWREQSRLTQAWLQGKIAVPEIRDKWAKGPIVKLALDAPRSVEAGQPIDVRVVLASNKVGHDFPTGPLDIIQSWVQVRVTDEAGRLVYSSGTRDRRHFIAPGTFMFKAEPVDQYGNLIDRHNLWEMVGVRYRRSLFPGYSDTVEYLIPCAADVAAGPAKTGAASGTRTQDVQVPASLPPGRYRIVVGLEYRKVDQFLLNFLFGPTNQLTAPVTEIVRATATVRVTAKAHAGQAQPRRVAAAPAQALPDEP